MGTGELEVSGNDLAVLQAAAKLASALYYLAAAVTVVAASLLALVIVELRGQR